MPTFPGDVSCSAHGDPPTQGFALSLAYERDIEARVQDAALPLDATE